ncbi:uncharacterized protein M6B38_101760 [Iris pallida]|uniref:Uncharacterized protein n=1 Tax=Iris pallida TaxID=29817 RepID=A0AAX6IMS6_IRIPA|nr:uncharacterized protein M6B38_101760 [Iris pallida]
MDAFPFMGNLSVPRSKETKSIEESPRRVIRSRSKSEKETSIEYQAPNLNRSG